MEAPKTDRVFLPRNDACMMPDFYSFKLCGGNEDKPIAWGPRKMIWWLLGGGGGGGRLFSHKTGVCTSSGPSLLMTKSKSILSLSTRPTTTSSSSYAAFVYFSLVRLAHAGCRIGLYAEMSIGCLPSWKLPTVLMSDFHLCQRWRKTSAVFRPRTTLHCNDGYLSLRVETSERLTRSDECDRRRATVYAEVTAARVWAFGAGIWRKKKLPPHKFIISCEFTRRVQFTPATTTQTPRDERIQNSKTGSGYCFLFWIIGSKQCDILMESHMERSKMDCGWKCEDTSCVESEKQRKGKTLPRRRSATAPTRSSDHLLGIMSVFHPL